MMVQPSATVYSDLLVNPLTGFATSSWQYKRTVPRSVAGDNTLTGHDIGLPIFLTASSEHLDVKINAVDADNQVLYTRTLSNASFQQAHKTLAMGSFFSPVTTSTFTFTTTQIIGTISLD